ncbi:unnamed protein product [Protopolystoma xenopodis]|uniref:Uncharacterized protein n=1 Tax=Protopolystoma xenopodis TaxID=117903 RepID=A0A3S5BDW6_9PLAT|nr:unnamed protein product [Protopolystoma xenopodis]
MSGSPVAKRSRSALCQPQSSASGSIMSEESGRLRVSASLRLTDTNQERVAFGSDTKDSSLSEHRQVDFRHDQQQSTHLRSLQTSPVSSPSPGVPQHANHDQKQPKNYQYNQHFRIRQSAYHSHSGNSDASEDDHAENEIDGDALKTVSFRTSTCTDQTPMTKRLIRLGQNSGERVDLARFRSDSSITRQASVAPRQPGISSGRKIDPASEGVEDDLVVEEERGVNTSCDERHFRLVNSKRSLQDFEANHREWVGLMNEKERLVNRPILEVVSEWSGDETIIKANEDQSRHDWRHSIRQLANANADKNECACVLEGKLCVEESGDKDDEEEVLFSDHISSKTNNHRYSDIRDCPLIPCLRPIRPLKGE